MTIGFSIAPGFSARCEYGVCDIGFGRVARYPTFLLRPGDVVRTMRTSKADLCEHVDDLCTALSARPKFFSYANSSMEPTRLLLANVRTLWSHQNCLYLMRQ